MLDLSLSTRFTCIGHPVTTELIYSMGWQSIFKQLQYAPLEKTTTKKQQKETTTKKNNIKNKQKEQNKGRKLKKR